MANENEITGVKVNFEKLDMEKFFEYANPNENDDEITHYLLEFF